MFEGYRYVDESGNGVRRFTNPQAVKTVYEHLSTEDLPDSRRRARIRGLYDGNLPYDPKKLENSAQKNLANINSLGLKGIIDNRASVILRLQSDTANLIELRPIARELAGPDAEVIGRVVAEEVSAMLRKNKRFIPALARMNKEADLYGLGPITWPTSADYCPVALDRAQVRFIGNGPVCSTDHELFMFESTLTADYLRFLLDNEEIAEAEGWNVAQVKSWLVRAYGEKQEESRDQPGVEGSTSMLEAQLSYVRRNVLGEDSQFKPFYVIHAFVKEIAWPRGITHIITPAAETTEKFMYEKRNAYRTMDECFMWYPYSVTDRYAREVRGLASFLYPIERVNNRLTCNIIDSAFLATSMVLTQNSGAAAAQDITISEQGRYTVLPAGLVPAQSQVKPDLQSLLTVKQALDQMGVASVGGAGLGPVATTGPSVFSQVKGQQTKTELELAQRLRSNRDHAEFSQREDVLNSIFSETFRRILRLAFLDPIQRVDFPEVDEFLSRCAMRGVTLEMLMTVPKLFTIVACRDLALGAEGKVAALDNYIQLYGGTIDEAGRRFIARESARLQFGQRDADRIISESSQNMTPGDQESKAADENNLMKLGFPATCGQDQLHWSHIPVHSQLLQEIVQMVAAPDDNTPDLNEFNGDPNQSMHIAEQTIQNLKEDPRKVLGMLEMCSSHVQEHLAIGGQQIGMKAQASLVQKMLRDLRPTVKALNLAIATQERVEQAQREQAERDRQKEIEVAAMEKAKVAEIEADRKAETERYRADREHEVAMYKADLEAQRGSVQSARDDRMAEAANARADAAARLKAENERRLTEARVNAANAVGRFNSTNVVTGNKPVRPSDIAGTGTDNQLSFESV